MALTWVRACNMEDESITLSPGEEEPVGIVYG